MQTGIPENHQSDTLESLKAELDKVIAERNTLEQRFKDTQKAYTQGQQSLKALEAENSVLNSKLSSTMQTGLLSGELDELKQTDPDEWYRRKRQAEIDAQQQLKADVNKAKQDAIATTQKEYNAKLLAEFKVRNPDITDEFINFDVPHRLKHKLDSGEITFSEFLGEVEVYAKKGKAIGGATPDTMNQPNLTQMGNSSGVSNTTAKDFETKYKNSVY